MSWRTWSYSEWNLGLVAHHFSTTKDAGTLERIAATPEELALVSGESPSHADEVSTSFVTAVRVMLPPRTTFAAFCQDYGDWTPDAEAAPHFFGMLWLTCLVAYGFPGAKLTFQKRMYEVLGKKDNLLARGEYCLPSLWRDLRSWTIQRRAAEAPIRELCLPSEVGVTVQAQA